MHLLSFDVEEYFQVEAAARGGVKAEQWDSFEKRLAPYVRQILELLNEHGATATFFVLGWVARHEPTVIRQIAQAGHEIASHGMTHRMMCRLTPRELSTELADSRKLLEDLCGRPVVGFRSPTFSITRETAWALDVLTEAGYGYDSSIFPVHHDRYGVPDAPRWPHLAAGPGGGEILEIPPLTLRAMGKNIPVGGGGYLRLLPAGLVARVLTSARKLGQPGMLYLHPWEFDPDQPILPMGRISRWRHRVNLSRTEPKLRRLLRQFKFGCVADCLESLSATVRQRFSYASPDRPL